MKSYKHLSLYERERIAVWKGRGLSLRDIAKKLGRCHSTLSREINRNRKPSYWPHKAQERAMDRLMNSHKRPRLKSRVMHYEIEQMLIKGWSPELISGRIRTHRPDLPRISPEAIYQWIYADRPDLVDHMARAHRKRKRRWKAKQNKIRIPERRSIQERPEIINERKEPGHWESDLLVGSGKAALQVAVERQSRLTRLEKIANKTAQASREALERMLKPMPKAWRRSITYDNGLENVEHTRLNQQLGTESWFCQPYHSWEKGQVENTNGLIRRFVPKRSNLDLLPEGKVRSVEEWLNDRPRKVLDFKTPKEVFSLGVALAP
jgi:transposase, IS30 family